MLADRGEASPVTLPPDTLIVRVRLTSCVDKYRALREKRGASPSPVLSFPYNMLVNIGLDMASSHRVCVSPVGVIFPPNVHVTDWAQAGAASDKVETSNEKTTLPYPVAVIVPVVYTDMDDHGPHRSTNLGSRGAEAHAALRIYPPNSRCTLQHAPGLLSGQSFGSLQRENAGARRNDVNGEISSVLALNLSATVGG